MWQMWHMDCTSLISLYIYLSHVAYYVVIETFTSRLTGSESQGQEAAACVCLAYVTTSVLFTGTNAVKFASAVAQLSWVLSLSYYKANTFL